MSDKNTQAVPATEGQTKQIVHIIENALPDTKWIEELLARLGLDKDGAQMLIETGNALHEVRKFLADKVKELSDSTLYANQVVESSYGYLSGYRKARPIDEQIAILRQYDWGREVDWSLNEAQQQLLAKPAPQGAEGYFAVVFDPTMVMHYEEEANIDQSGPVTLALNALREEHEGRLANNREGMLGPQHYRRNKKSAEKMKLLWESQGRPSGIILIPAQLGREHRGKSTLRACVVIRGSEFPLDAYETIQMVLTHKNRLSHSDDLWLDLPGAEYSPGADGVFDLALSLEFDVDRVRFIRRSAACAYDQYGSVSGFLPESNWFLNFECLMLLHSGTLNSLNPWVYVSAYTLFICCLILRGEVSIPQVYIHFREVDGISRFLDDLKWLSEILVWFWEWFQYTFRDFYVNRFMSFLLPTAFAISAESAAEHIGPHIPKLAGEATGLEIFGISISTTVFSTWLFMACFFIAVAVLYRAATTSNLPKIKAAGIDLVKRMDVFFLELLGESQAARRYLWLVAGFFVFIFFANLFGLVLDLINLIIPSAHAYLRPINSDLNTTLVLSTTIILVAQATGVYGRGFVRHYWHYLFNFHGNSFAEKCVSVFIGWLHFIGEFIRIGSLSLRLFLNIFVGIILIGVVVYIGTLLPGYGIGKLLSLPFWFFELLVAFLQAYIFMTLSGLYLKESLSKQH